MIQDTLTPFKDDAVLSVGDLHVENGPTTIVVHGDVEISLDQRGLADARALARAFTDIVTTLEARGNLPDVAPASGEDHGEVQNPFA